MPHAPRRPTFFLCRDLQPSPVSLLLALCVVAGTLSGCRTIQGAGEDLSNAGRITEEWMFGSPRTQPKDRYHGTNRTRLGTGTPYTN